MWIERPHRDAEYLRWIRTLPCCICGAQPVDAHHIVSGGVGQKCSDFWTVPLCRKDHRQVHASKATWALRMHAVALQCLSNYVAALRADADHRLEVTDRPPVRVVQPGAEGPPARIRVKADEPF